MASYDMIMSILAMVFTFISLSSIVEGGLSSEMFSKFSDQLTSTSGSVNGTKWAVLVAGSNYYENYRHQADVCHAYHVLKDGGLKDENIIVFMYDDIAYDQDNPKPGVIINSLHGKNVYPGVVKDYTGKEVTANNLYAVLLGNKTALTGGSGKVLSTGPNDHIFVYYSDHGGPGLLGMPGDDETALIYAKDFIDVLKKKHASKTYKSMVIYVEACEAGSIFDGLLPNNLNIYVTTASNPEESSYACYCDVSKEYEDVCLGDLYSVAWLEDSENSNTMKETLQEQYLRVKKRTGNTSEPFGYSHVMQYGDHSISQTMLASYIGAKPSRGGRDAPQLTPLAAIEQREADLFHLKRKVQKAPLGSNERIDAQKKLDEKISQRKHVDQSVAAVGVILLGAEDGTSLYKRVRPAGQPVVDDWECLKSMVNTYETYCGSLRTYGRKYMRAFANLCNAGVRVDQMAQAAAKVCAK